MATTRHGISIGIERINDHLYMTFKAFGILTHEDYVVMVPMIESALKGIDEPAIDALIDLSDMEGWQARAAWDDFKLGMKHRRDFKRIAVIGNNKWEELFSRVGGWFISGELQYFENERQACEWLTSAE